MNFTHLGIHSFWVLTLLSLNYGKEGKEIIIIEHTSLAMKDGWIYIAAAEMQASCSDYN